MEFRQLQHFMVVAQELNFSKAAEKTYISQQALSKSIKMLEEELEVSLFERLPRGLKLTEYGQILLKHSYKISEDFLEAHTAIRRTKEFNNQNLVIAMTAGVEDTFPVSVLFDFQRKYLKHNLKTLINNDRVIEKMLSDETIDFAIVGATGNSELFDYHPLIRSESRVIVHKNNPLSRKDSVTIDDLKNETFLFSSTDYNVNKHFITLCGVHGFTPKIVHQSAGIGFMLLLANENQGIMLSPDTVDKLPIPSTLKRIRLENDPCLFHIHIAQKKGVPLRKNAQFLKQYILDHVERR